MKTVDVLLVLPPMYQLGRIPDYNPKEPMALMYLAAVLRQEGYTTTIIDAGLLALSIEETINEISSYKSWIIGFSVLQRALPSLKLIVQKLRQQDIASHICCGGITATLSAPYILSGIPEINSIVMGEGEYTFLKLVRAVLHNTSWKHLEGIAFQQNGRVIINPPAKKPHINILPFPVRDLLPICLEKTNYATILASRGCYANCTFCSNSSFERVSVGYKWRGRSPENLAEEIETLLQKYGVKVFKFNDPNIFGPGIQGREHVANFCKEIIHRGMTGLHFMGFCRADNIDYDIACLMRKAGFERLLIGIETSNPEVLRLFRKGESLTKIKKTITILRKTGIDLIPGFMIFNPYTTVQTLKEDIIFLEEYKFTPTLSKNLRVFDGAPIQSILASEGRLIRRNPIEGYHEYIVDRQVAAIYMSLKTAYVMWIDTFKKSYQEEIWGIKKAPSFTDRETYYSLTRLIFSLELALLKKLIYWVENNFTLEEIASYIKRLKSQLLLIEEFVVDSTNSPPKENISVDGLDGDKLAHQIFSMLTAQPFRTFPERYRWQND